MKIYMRIILAVWAVLLTSCSKDTGLSEHLLSGNYLGSWDTQPIIELKMTIGPNRDCDRLFLYFSLADSSEINIKSESHFDIDRFEEYGKKQLHHGRTQK